MSLTPVEIRHVRLGRGVGYKREAVDRLLADVVNSFEDVWRDRADLADRVETLHGDLQRYREMESILRSTLVSAESSAADLRERARHEGQIILDEARSEARAVTREALRERDQLLQEARRIRSLLGSALAAFEDAADDSATQPAPPVVEQPAVAAPTQPAARTSAAADRGTLPLLDDTQDHALGLDESASSGSRAA